jgi:hypothetical protein
MSKYTHGLLHVLTIALGVGTYLSGVVPTKYQPLIIAVTGLIQAILALSNPPNGVTNVQGSK